MSATPPSGGISKPVGTVSFAQFKTLDLRTANILEAEEIPGADRLWKLRIDTGDSIKEIVAGIKAHYSREALLGKTIVVVHNLEPAVIRGVESSGMLLAAKSGETLSLLAPDKSIPPGSPVS